MLMKKRDLLLGLEGRDPQGLGRKSRGRVGTKHAFVLLSEGWEAVFYHLTSGYWCLC